MRKPGRPPAIVSRPTPKLTLEKLLLLAMASRFRDDRLQAASALRRLRAGKPLAEVLG